MKRLTGTMMTRAALVGALLLATSGCGGDSDTGDGNDGTDISADEMAELFVDSGAPADEAECVGARLEGTLTRADVEQFIASDDGTDVPENVLAEIGEALGECVD